MTLDLEKWSPIPWTKIGAGPKCWGQWLRFPAKVEQPHFWPYFRNFLNDSDFFLENPDSSLSVLYCPLTSYQISERSYDRFSRKSPGGRTNEWTNGGKSTGPTSKVGGSKKKELNGVANKQANMYGNIIHCYVQIQANKQANTS